MKRNVFDLIIDQEKVKKNVLYLNIVSEYIYSNIKDLEREYINFNNWFLNKTIPDVLDGKKSIISRLYNDEFAGISILKNTPEEKKICTIRVPKKFQNAGFGKSLFEKSFEILGTEKPLITVSTKRIAQFEKILKYYGFEKAAVYKNKYNPLYDEIAFNDILRNEK